MTGTRRGGRRGRESKNAMMREDVWRRKRRRWESQKGTFLWTRNTIIYWLFLLSLFLLSTPLCPSSSYYCLFLQLHCCESSHLLQIFITHTTIVFKGLSTFSTFLPTQLSSVSFPAREKEGEREREMSWIIILFPTPLSFPSLPLSLPLSLSSSIRHSPYSFFFFFFNPSHDLTE